MSWSAKQNEDGRDARAAVRAWRTECAGWLALGRAPEADGVYIVRGYPGMVTARRHPRALHRSPAMILLETGGPEPPAERLALALAHLGPVEEPVYLMMPPDAQFEPWEETLDAAGFAYESTQLLMTCPLPRRARDGSERRALGLRPGSVLVEAAETDEDRKAALAVAAEGFHDPPRMAAFYNPRGVVRLYLARLVGEPAAVAAMWPFAGVAGIYSVTTRQRFRGLGLAYAVVERILEDAAKAGFDLASLRTTPDLEGLYERHGFRTSGFVRRYRRVR